MNDNSFPSLAVDEQLLFVALTTLADIEGREQQFELLNVTREYAADEAVADRFRRAVGRAIAAKTARRSTITSARSTSFTTIRPIWISSPRRWHRWSRPRSISFAR
jgi:hypothetical protein